MNVKIISYICLSVLLIAGTPAFGASPGVEVTAPAPKLVSPRGFPSLVFVIKNTGNTEDTFDLSLHLPEGWSSITSVKPVTLKSGGHKKKLITISVPLTAQSDKIYPVKLTATSRTDHSVQATGTARISVKPVLGLRLTPQPYPKLAWAGETINYEFKIRNLGNGEDTLEVQAHSSRDWKLHLPKKEFVLGPYQDEVVKVALMVPKGIMQEQINLLSFRVFSVTAEKEGKDISDEAKLRLKIIPIVEKRGKTYLELPGSIELQTLMVIEETKSTPETRIRFDTGGDLTEEYNARLHFQGRFFGEEEPGYKDNFEDYFFDLNKKDKWYTTLGKTYAYLSPLTEDLSGTGMSIRTYGERIETTIFAGENDACEDNNEYGAGANVKILVTEQSRVGLTSTFINGKQYPRKRGLFSVSGEHRLFEPLNLYGEVGYGFKKSDTEEGGDIGLLARTEYDLETLGINAEYYRAPPNYPGSWNDQEGFRVYSRYQLIEPVSFWLNYHHYNDNVDDDPTRLSITYDKLELGSRLIYGEWPSVDLTWELDKRKSGSVSSQMGENVAGVNSLDNYVSLNLYKSFTCLTLAGLGKWGIEEQRIENTKRNVFELGATASGYYKMFNWMLSYDRSNRRGIGIDYRETRDKIQYELGCHLYNILGLNVMGDVIGYNEIINTNGSRARTNRYDADLEIVKEIGARKRHEIGLKGEIDNITEDMEREYRIGLVWRWNFDTPVPWIKIKGIIRGQVFLDKDGNGSRGENEKVYPKTRITLDRTTVYTDKKGVFEFPVLDPGEYRLNVDMSQLPSGLVSSISLPRNIALRKGDDVFVDIPLEQIGTIQGAVFDDRNKNKQRDESEDGLSPIRVILLKNGKEVQESFTDQQGRYIITDIKPGDYIVKIDKEYLPGRYVMTTPETIKVSIKSKQQITGIDFGAYEKPRKIIKTFIKKKK